MEEIVTTAVETVAETAAETASGFEVLFEPMNFVSNLYYMGTGMLGIFIVIGIIIGATVVMNKLTSRKKN